MLTKDKKLMTRRQRYCQAKRTLKKSQCANSTKIPSFCMIFFGTRRQRDSSATSHSKCLCKNTGALKCKTNVISSASELIEKQITSFGPRQANLVLIAYASSEGSGESAHPRSLARTFAARSYKQ